ncbi:MAG: DUF1566 domain-containing protein [Elusimicrobiota bacterium]|nr:DUF1566 domain-containing protein [Elusimicrobiota bacterium]
MNKIILLLVLGLAPRLVSAADVFELAALKAGDVPASVQPVPEAALPAAAEKKPAASPEYTVYNPAGISSVTVSNRTGLMWITNPDDAGIGGAYNRRDAILACGNLEYAGYSDWRLPKPGELVAIINVNGPYPGNNGYFLNAKSKYWTSAPPALSAAYAWSLQFAVGSMYNIGSTGLNYVRCVR